MADQGGRILAEEDRLRRGRHAALGGVVAVVQPDADDLARVRHRRQEPGLGRVVRDAAAGQGRPRPRCRSGSQVQQLAHARRHLGIGRVDIDILPLNHPAGPRPLLGRHGHPAHVMSSSSDGILVDVSGCSAAGSEYQPGGVAVEVERRSGVPAKGRGRARLADRSAEGGEHGVGLPRAGDDHRDERGRRAGRGSSGCRRGWDLFDAARSSRRGVAGCGRPVEPDDLDQDGVEEVGDRGVVEGEVAVLADPRADDVGRLGAATLLVVQAGLQRPVGSARRGSAGDWAGSRPTSRNRCSWR